MHRPILRVLAAAAAAALGLTPTGCGTTASRAPASDGYPLTVARAVHAEQAHCSGRPRDPCARRVR